MMLWVFIALMAAVSLVVLAWPFFAAPKAGLHFDETDYLAAQLDDVERDRARGVLSEEEAGPARLEAKRRLLATGRAVKDAPSGGASAVAANLRQGAIMGVGAVPLAAIALYLGIGAPDAFSGALSTAPAGERAPAATGAETSAPPVGELIAGLEARLAENPGDVNGWVRLAESYAEFNRFAEAATAFGKAAALDPASAYLEAARGEALVLANRGAVSKEAQAAFARALDLDGREPRARYYSALGVYQKGDKEEALTMLAALVNEAPDSAPWLPIAHNELVSIAMELGQTLEQAGLSEAAQTRFERMMAADIARAPADTAASQEDAGRLEALIASGDAQYTDWLRLAEIYAAAGEPAKTADVLARARTRYAAAPFVLQQIAAAEAQFQSAAQAAPARRGPTAADIAAAQSMSPEDQQMMIQGMVEGLATRLEAAPDDPEGWLMLARSYGVLGDLGKSAEALARAAALRPDDVNMQIAYARALLAATDAAGETVGAEAEAVLRKALTLDDAQPFALYFLGLAAKQKNDNAAAKRYWERLAAQLPPDSADAKEIAGLIKSLNE